MIDLPKTPPSLGWKALSSEQITQALHGKVSLRRGPDARNGQGGESGIEPFRLRIIDYPFIHPYLSTRAWCTAGVVLRLQTDAQALRISLTAIPPLPELGNEEAGFDLCVNGQLLYTSLVKESEKAYLSYTGLPSGKKLIEFYFPTTVGVILHSVEISSGGSCGIVAKRPQWITYGSSITHCRAAASPSQTWPALVAQQWGWEGTNLGFSGQCIFDSIVARTIRDLPAERISLCLGINTVEDIYSLRTWLPAIEGFIMTIRDGHPETPLLIISPIFSATREAAGGGHCVIALRTMRELLAEMVERFRQAGDTHIFYLNGLSLIGPEDASCMPDGLHPNAEGICLLAQRFTQHAPLQWRSEVY